MKDVKKTVMRLVGTYSVYVILIYIHDLCLFM